ncbi:MAG: substrate-binding domain-containing protein [Verrucomicrobiaceae bacterium]
MAAAASWQDSAKAIQNPANSFEYLRSRFVMKKKHPHVLVALGWYDHRLLQGIATYATEHSWHLAAHSIIHEKVIPWGWEGDGVLAWLAADDELARFVMSVKKPTVDFSLRRAELPFAHVVQDHALTGGMVAAHFLERGLRHFAIYSDSENWSQMQRGEAFERHLRQRGHACEAWRWDDKTTRSPQRRIWAARRRWLVEHLRSAPKPLALFALNGSLAVEAHELCADAKISVPQEVAIVGIDDYLLSVGAHSSHISGVDTRLEEQGYRGAELLDRIMRTGRTPSRPIRIAPSGVVTRKSSDMLAVPVEGLSKALRFIMAHFAEPLAVRDIAAAAGMSERSLHLAFTTHLGTTPGMKLIQTRIDHAIRLLTSTNEKIESIATRCGYPSLNAFFIAFKKDKGTTPAAFRREANRFHPYPVWTRGRR